jgi:hypothetical protein
MKSPGAARGTAAIISKVAAVTTQGSRACSNAIVEVVLIV